MNEKYTLILLSGGVGSRMAADQPKQLLKINGIPMLVYSLVAISEIDEIDEIIINYPAGYLDDTKSIVSNYAGSANVRYIEAGETRQDSVRKMLEISTNSNIIIHESARPMVDQADFREIINCEYRNVSFSLAIPFTVAPVDPENSKISGFLERERLVNIQLPQKFNREDLALSHKQAVEQGKLYTEDATMCVESGIEVNYINGKDENIKITKPIDIKIAEFLLKGNEIYE
ncbi:MAG: IspD/TarI family cytidylyltransferase [Paenalcaligenes sp.]